MIKEYKNHLLWLTSGIFLLLLLILQHLFSHNPYKIIGLADSREIQINFEYPVEIRRIHVISGQKVAKGELLLEINQKDVNLRIDSLTTQIKKLEAQQRILGKTNRILFPKLKNSPKDDVFDLDLASLKKELETLQKMKKNHHVFSPVDGVIGNVNFKKGEYVSAFGSILSISLEHPSYVQSFIHESVISDLKSGDVVEVQSLARDNQVYTGTVVAEGSRIVQIPQRFLKIQTMVAWGRELIIELPENNRLLLGEKVGVSKKKNWVSFFPKAIAEQSALAEAKSLRIEEMLVSDAIDKISAIEPSGLLELPDLNKFLLISDDTDKQNTPYLFLMNKDGTLEDEPLLIKGLDEMQDIESITADDRYIYLLASQSEAKKKNQKAREMLHLIERKGEELKLAQSVHFAPLMKRALKNHDDKLLRKLEKQWDEEESVDIEAMGIHKGALYIGFKTPLFDEQILILKVADYQSLMTHQLSPSQLSVWKKFELPIEYRGHEMRISDLCFVNSQMFFATTCKGKSCSALWRFSHLQGATPQLVQVFPDQRLEGIAVDVSKNTLYGVFDEGSRRKPFYFKYRLKAE